MKNRVYYGEYSLKHWIGLMLSGNIELPRYQRKFCWNQESIKKLIQSLRDKDFVPPITIGAFTASDGKTHNYIIDGQQRLTSILLACIKKYPNAGKFKLKENSLAEGDDGMDSEGEDKTILEWRFDELLGMGKNIENIRQKIATDDRYDDLAETISDEVLEDTFLGFSYIVSNTSDQNEQQKYYSRIFKHINTLGKVLLPEESRRALYFLNGKYTKLLDSGVLKSITIMQNSEPKNPDFVRYLAYLFDFCKLNDPNTTKVAYGYGRKREEYFSEFITTIVEEKKDHQKFPAITFVFPNPDNDITSRLDALRSALNNLSIPKDFNTIIDADMYLLGLIYYVIIKGKTIDITNKDDLDSAIKNKINDANFKSEAHKRAPNALKYTVERIKASINIYKDYVQEPAL
ncbi:MAG: DUF262 domain-containing protein [Bacteroidales bacterium]|nr:DUF262 domain-containing protein [Bacteroidales bacterium]